MMYKVLTQDQLVQLHATLKESLPGTAKVFYTIRHILNEILTNFECLVDSWPKYTCFVVRPCTGKEVPAFFQYSYICHTKSASTLKYFLQRPGVIDWTKPVNFSGIPYDLIPTTRQFCRKLGGTMQCRPPHFMYAWCKTVPIDLTRDIPVGFELGSLCKSDAAALLPVWSSSLSEHDGIEEYFKCIIENFESSCLRNTSTGELVAYACRKFNGSISMVYVKPEHRGTHFSSVVFKDIASKIAANGDIPFGFLATDSNKLIEMARILGFTWVPQSNMTWATYLPSIKMTQSERILS
ncbi:glycine N-acyltransferase [Octopus bimaculoides]|uniref:Glycine N-acyltransferase-like protein n=1 Tax=Octopus bimaculoides TaxID=37653 RepID=A0A0L8I1X7_OCTBM|nr:glycine N-acyltransferase [Octopus bimaculoides]|eukprot:XP_014767769.1 PREDICTED: glycine N-acyltransferase-like [Octopus bimaculoides]